VNGLLEAPTEIASRIEVFKGPGPADYGSNAVHGLINVVLDNPGSGNGSLSLQGSSRGYANVSLVTDLSESLRVSADLAHDDGFRDDSGFDQQKLTIQHYAEIGDWDISSLVALNNLNQETAGFLQTGQEVEIDGEIVEIPNEAYRFRDLIETNFFPQAFRDTQALRGQIKATRETGYGTLILQPYARRTQQRFLRHFVPGQALDKNGHTSFGFKSGLYDDGWSVGVDAEYTSGFQYEFQENPTALAFLPEPRRFPEGLHYDYEVDAIVLAGFATKDFELSDRATLHVGARGEYTAGVRGEAFERGKFEVTAFTMRKDNFFFRNADGFNVVNGKTRHEGFEASLELNLGKGFSLNGTGTLARHTYDFTEAANDITDGDRVDTAPDTLGNIALRYDADKFGTYLRWTHVGSYFTDPANTQTYPGHDIFTLGGRVDMRDDLQLSLRVDNLFDTRYADRADFAFGNERYFPGRPRTLFAGLTLSLD